MYVCMYDIIVLTPPLSSLKTPADSTEHTLHIACVEVAGGAAAGWADAALCAALTHAADGIRLAQRLVDAPPNLMHTDAMLEECRALAARPVAGGSVRLDVIRGEELRDQGFGGLYNVGMAGPKPPALAVLSFDPSGAPADAQTVCWVGKGIIYDTGKRLRGGVCVCVCVCGWVAVLLPSGGAP